MGDRGNLARILAPAAFLAACTVAILLVRAGLSNETTVPPPVTTVETQSVPVETVPTLTTRDPTTTTPPADSEFYEIQSGDTLDVIAANHDTTVEQLLVLNPDLDPVALGIGQRIRVR